MNRLGMRWTVLFGVLALAACDAERDLASERFACGFGGPCDAGAMSDASEDAAVDAGPPPACDPSFGTQPTCGGALEGEYRFASACSSRYVMESFLESCPGAVRRGQTFTINGTMTLNASTLSAQCSLMHQERAFLPSICTNALGGCDGINGIFTAQGFGSGACVVEGTGCECTVSTVGGCIDSGAIMKSDPSFTIDMNLEYFFCTETSSLIYVPAEPDGFSRQIVYVTTKVR